MYTLGYSFRPWEEAKAIADGPSILSYVRETASDHGIDREDPLRPSRRARRVVLGRRALDRRGPSARTRRDGPADLRLPVHVHRLLPLRRGLHAGLRGHRALRRPHRAPAALDRGPRLRRQARRRDRQRRHRRDAGPRDGRERRARDDAAALAQLRRLAARRRPDRQVPAPRAARRRLAYPIVRWKNVLLTMLVFQLSRRRPGSSSGWCARGSSASSPPGYDIDTHFNPRYNPWDQRLCLVPDGDLFEAISAGRASIVTDHIETFTETGSSSSPAPSSRPT